jgi:hypothetical protein
MLAFILQNSNDTLMKQVYEKCIAPHEPTLPETMLEGLQWLCTRDKYATMSTERFVLSNWNQLPCTAHRVPKAYMTVTISMVIQKNSPFLGILKQK